MPAVTFTPPRPPRIDATRVMQPRVIVASFGDGYSQRTGAGLNTRPQSWSLTWGPMSATDIDTIEAFLAERGGVEPFRWTPPRASSPRVFVCQEWQVVERGASLAELTARFDEVFDLGA